MTLRMLLFLSSLISIVSCSNPSSSTENKTPLSDTIFGNGFNGYYMRLEGAIANQPVVLHLEKLGDRFQAIYSYNSIGQWIPLAVDSSVKDSLYLSEQIPGNNWSETQLPASTWRCLLKNGILQGEWLSSDHKKSFPFTLKESYPIGSIKFAMMGFSDSAKGLPQAAETPVAESDFMFVVAPHNDWLNKQICNILNIDSNLSFKDGVNKSNTQYFADYRDQLKDIDSLRPIETFNYARYQTIMPVYNDRNLITLQNDFYEFSGGAHGNYGTLFHTYDLINKKELKLSDLIQIDSITLQPIVERAFREQYRIKVKNLSQVLFDPHLATTDNFYITNKGIGFLYNPYEVASYAQGQINVFVPFSALKQWLSPYTKSQFGISNNP
ncbi:MAG: DUF3298 domain-containing protein [Bacteroidetes bacterium]|nr:DUF3298 domain-containing protein [Bacteroidota bacterium]MBS1740867.1 DUF3298 domain-containing protein [Bacteroidota bacterium]